MSNRKHLADAQTAVFEMIYALASDAVDIVERKASTPRKPTPPTGQI